MEDMSLEEEWIASIPSESTRRHYLKDWKLFRDFLGKTDDKIVELWARYDTLGIMQQLGVIPTPGMGK